MRRRIFFRRRRGQSLVEMAFSLLFLFLLLSGLIDLGRAFFTKIDMDTVISEGANWGAAYPGCIPSANNTTNAAQVDPRCRGTNSVLCRMMNENRDLSANRITALSVEPINAQPGQMVTMTIKYQFPLITPFIQAMFGKDLELSSQVKEVVRGANVPDVAGDTSLCSQGGVNPTTSVIDPKQFPVACDGGLATLQWGNVSATGYHIWRSHVSKPFPAPDVTRTDVGDPTTLYSWQDPNQVGVGGAAGSRTYTITSYNTAGAVTTDSDPLYVSASCAPIQPANLRFLSCAANGANLDWQLPVNANGVVAVDLSVAGWQVVNTATGIHTDPFAAGASSGNYLFDDPADRTGQTFYMQAVDSGGVFIGSPAAPTNPDPFTWDCPPTNAEIALSVAQNPSPAYAGNNLTYKFTVSNPGPATANGIHFTASLCTSGVSPCPAYTIISMTPSSGSCTNTGPAIDCTSIAPIPASSTATVDVVVNPTTTGTLSITGNVTETTPQFSTIDDNASLNSVISMVPTSMLDISVGGPSTIVAGNAVEYTIIVTNNGTGTALSVNLSAGTPSGLTFTSVIVIGGPSCTNLSSCSLGDINPAMGKTIKATYVVPVTYVPPPNPISFTATAVGANASAVTSAPKFTMVTAPAVQNFAYDVVHPCYSHGNFRTYTFTWNAYTWPGVDHFRITDQTTIPHRTWSSATGSGGATSMTIPTGGGFLDKRFSNDYYYIEAISASGTVIGSRSVPSVSTTCN